MIEISPFTLAIGMGVVAGLRSMTAPAAVALAARWKWLDLEHSGMSLLGSAPAAVIFPILAIGELVVDKLPKAPSRKMPASFLWRLITGALSGGAICVGARQPAALGALLGAAGAVVGTLGGYKFGRTSKARAHRSSSRCSKTRPSAGVLPRDTLL
jgi:uncharacterized membrane protein